MDQPLTNESSQSSSNRDSSLLADAYNRKPEVFTTSEDEKNDKDEHDAATALRFAVYSPPSAPAEDTKEQAPSAAPKVTSKVSEMGRSTAETADVVVSSFLSSAMKEQPAQVQSPDKPAEVAKPGVPPVKQTNQDNLLECKGSSCNANGNSGQPESTSGNTKNGAPNGTPGGEGSKLASASSTGAETVGQPRNIDGQPRTVEGQPRVVEGQPKPNEVQNSVPVVVAMPAKQSEVVTSGLVQQAKPAEPTVSQPKATPAITTDSSNGTAPLLQGKPIEGIHLMIPFKPTEIPSPSGQPAKSPEVTLIAQPQPQPQPQTRTVEGTTARTAESPTKDYVATPTEKTVAPGPQSGVGKPAIHGESAPDSTVGTALGKHINTNEQAGAAAMMQIIGGGTKRADESKISSSGVDCIRTEANGQPLKQDVRSAVVETPKVEIAAAPARSNPDGGTPVVQAKAAETNPTVPNASLKTTSDLSSGTATRPQESGTIPNPTRPLNAPAFGTPGASETPKGGTPSLIEVKPDTPRAVPSATGGNGDSSNRTPAAILMEATIRSTSAGILAGGQMAEAPLKQNSTDTNSRSSEKSPIAPVAPIGSVAPVSPGASHIEAKPLVDARPVAEGKPAGGGADLLAGLRNGTLTAPVKQAETKQVEAQNCDKKDAPGSQAVPAKPSETPTRGIETPATRPDGGTAATKLGEQGISNTRTALENIANPPKVDSNGQVRVDVPTAGPNAPKGEGTVGSVAPVGKPEAISGKPGEGGNVPVVGKPAEVGTGKSGDGTPAVKPLTEAIAPNGTTKTDANAPRSSDANGQPTNRTTDLGTAAAHRGSETTKPEATGSTGTTRGSESNVATPTSKSGETGAGAIVGRVAEPTIGTKLGESAGNTGRVEPSIAGKSGDIAGTAGRIAEPTSGTVREAGVAKTDAAAQVGGRNEASVAGTRNEVGVRNELTGTKGADAQHGAAKIETGRIEATAGTRNESSIAGIRNEASVGATRTEGQPNTNRNDQPAIRDTQIGSKAEAPLGTKLEAQVGTKVDAQVGTKVEAQIGTKVEAQIGHKADAQISGKNDVQVGSKVDAQVGTKVDAQVGNKIDAPAGTKVDAQISSKAEAQISSKAEAQVGSKAEAPIGNRNEIVGNKIDAQVGHKVDAHVGHKVDNLIGTKAEVQIGTKAEGQIGTRADAQIATKADAQIGSRVDGPQTNRVLDGQNQPTASGRAEGNQVVGQRIDKSEATVSDARSHGNSTNNGLNETSKGSKENATSNSTDRTPNAKIEGVRPINENGQVNTHLVNLISAAVTESGIKNEARLLLEQIKHIDGDLHVRNDEEVYYFPGLKVALRLADIIRLADCNGDEKDEAEPTSKSAQEKAKIQHRTRYTVQLGETLDSIAIDILGDIRFVGLIVTINRSEIIFRVENGMRVPTVMAGQVIWLPAPDELETYQKHYFTSKKSGTPSRYPAISQPNINTPVWVSANGDLRTPTPSRQSRENSISRQTRDPISVQNSDSSPMALVIYRVRHAGNRQSISIQEPQEDGDDQITERRCYQVRLGETLQSVALRDPLMNDIRMWKLVAHINRLSLDTDQYGKPLARLEKGQILILPTDREVAEFKFLNKLSAVVNEDATIVVSERNPAHPQQPLRDVQSFAPPSRPTGEPMQIEGSVSVKKLAEYCRVMVAVSADETSFAVKLQALSMNNWATVVAYESRPAGSVHTTYNRDGSFRAMALELPSTVVQQMAIEDLTRNWNLYCTRFFRDGSSHAQRNKVGEALQGAV